MDEENSMVSGAGPDHRHTERVQGPEETCLSAFGKLNAA